MSFKLSRLKKWLSLDDSAEYLSLILSETVRVRDLIHVALEGELSLFLKLSSPAMAIRYQQKKPTDLTTRKNLLDPNREEDLAKLLKFWREECWTLELAPEELYEPAFDDRYSLTNVWSFPCKDAPRNIAILTRIFNDIQSNSPETREDWYSNLPFRDNEGPIIVQCPATGETLGLVEFNYQELHKAKNSFSRDCYEQMKELPCSAHLGITQVELQRFADSLNEPEAVPPDDHMESLPADFRALYNAMGAGELPHLDLLIVAWRHFWKDRRPNDGKDYPINPDVAEWVKSRMDNPEQGNSKAKAIASIIRPNWAPTGRQPNRNQ